MKTKLAIAKAELQSLFYSPVAWFLLLVFLLQAVYDVAAAMNAFQTRDLQINTGLMLTTDRGMLQDVQNSLYLYIPLLTMGLISRELNSGSIKLLFSSPVKVSQIVIGKYIAVVIYWLLVMLVLLTVVFGCYFSISKLDWPFILSGMLGIFLMACTYSAIGLFMSSLTSYAVVAALSTLTLLAALKYMGVVWQDIDFLRDIAGFLDLNAHTTAMRKGLIISRDLVYFLGLSVIFAGLTIFRLQDMIFFKKAYWKVMRYVFLVIGIIAIGYVSSSRVLTKYWDVTPGKTNTISDESQDILRQLKGPVTITAYVNLLESDVALGMGETRNADLKFWEPYIRFIPQVQLRYVNYYDTTDNDYIFKNKKFRGWALKDIAEHVARGRDWDIEKFIPPAEIRKRKDIPLEDNKLVRIVEYNGRKTSLRIFDDAIRDPSEQEIITAFQNLLTEKPVVAFLRGHEERSLFKKGDQELQRFPRGLRQRNSMVNQGFDIIELTADKQLPDTLAGLVIADPEMSFAENELQNIFNYIGNGGDLVLMAEPGRNDVLQPLLDTLGIELLDGMLYSDRPEVQQNVILASLTADRSRDKVAMESAVGLRYKNRGLFSMKPLLIADQNEIWISKKSIKLDTGRVHFDSCRGDKRVSVPVALELTRKVNGKLQHIVVTGDADFMSNAGIRRRVDGVSVDNAGFSISLFKIFSKGKYPISIPTDRTSSIGGETKVILTEKRAKLFKYLYYGALPLLLVLSATILLVYRKRR